MTTGLRPARSESSAMTGTATVNATEPATWSSRDSVGV